MKEITDKKNVMPESATLQQPRPPVSPPRKTKTINFRVTEYMYDNLNSFASKRAMTLSELMEDALEHFIDRELTVDYTNGLFNMFPKEIQAQILINELKLPESMRLYTYAVAKCAAREAVQ